MAKPIDLDQIPDIPPGKEPKNPKELVAAAAQALDALYHAEDMRAKNIADESPRRGNPLNQVALTALRRRCLEVKDQGASNIAVDVNLLIELLNGSLVATSHGFVSNMTV